MTGPGLPQEAACWLLGRDRECGVIDALLEDARAGMGGALVVRGEAGIGKSALLGYARQRAAPMMALSAGGVQAESDLAFAGLHELLRPVLRYLGELPDTQSRALAGALGLAPSPRADRLLISAAVLGLLAAAAEDRPVLCVVDDAQWVDRPSADALVFTARRLRADRIAILFGAREGEVSRFEAAGLSEVALTGLNRQSADAVLAAGVLTVVPSVRDRLLAEAGGNPLALLELPQGLSAEQRQGLVPLPDAMPLTPRLESVFRQRIGQLPGEAQTVLLIAAADNTGEVPAVLRAAAGLRLPADALDPAQQAGLVQVTGATITFRHPLVRSALYQAATLSQRQRVHAALAGALSGEENTDRRVWHQAMATLTGDEEVAAALEASARRAQLRAGHASAATAFLRAAELSTDGARRVRRLAAAAQAAWDAGQPDRAREITGRALLLAAGQTRAQLLHLRGVIEARTGSMREACAMLLAAADACTDPSLTLDMLSEAAEGASFSGDMAAVREIGQRALRLPAADELDGFKLTLLRAFARLYAGDHQDAQVLLADALRRAATLTDPRALLWAADAASISNGLGAGLPYVNRAVDLARRNGLFSLLPLALRRQAAEFMSLSQFDLADAAAQEGYRLALDLGYFSSGHLANIAAVEAMRGREQDARRHAAEALALARQRGSWFPAVVTEWTLGLIDLAAGRPAEAAGRLLAITGPEHPDRNPVIALEANKEIAAQLYLSPRTVDYHLRKVFTKLGITSRTELVRDGLPPAGPA